MKVVAVAACTLGVAHTYMAKEAIIQEAVKRGISVKVETQGASGIDNYLEQDEIDNADFVLLAVAVAVDESERFEEKMDEGKVLSVDPAECIRNCAKVFDKLLALR